jgi:hypothetical protein
MKKHIIFESEEDLVIFKDINSNSSFYAMTKDVLETKIEIAKRYGREEKNVPEEFTIKVCPVKFVRSKDSYTDIYIPYSKELIDFPINRIEWIYIQIVQPRF